MKWTKEQQEAIEIREKNILVSAAAGSGKTAVLVERIKQLILRDHVPLDRMLIVTFSNAAASEMREKIVNAISAELEALVGSDQPDSNTTFLRDQLNLIHRSNISTFHAFAMEVIRRYFYLIDIEPNFKICDEAQKTILQAEAMEQLFNNEFESCNQDFLEFLNRFAQTKNDSGVKDLIYEVHHFIQSIPDSFQWLKTKSEELCCSKEAFLHSQTFIEMKNEIERSLALAESCFAKAGERLEDQGITSLTQKNLLEIEAIAALRTSFQNRAFDEFGAMLSSVKFQTYSASKTEKESYEEIKESVSSLRDKGKSLVKTLISRYFSRPLKSYVEDLNKTSKDALYLYGLVVKFDKLYKEKKRAKGLIDFNDIEHYALDILSREDAAAEYRNKFEFIFIDEYQDSNIVQETLINKIKKDNNLFMVGDVKQSIYKFRLAEPEIFIGKYEAFKACEDGKNIKLDLNRNFRSKGNIIASVNDIFRQIMSKDLAGMEYDDAAALYQGTPYEGELDYPVELHLIDEKQVDDLSIDDEIREMKKAEMEAYAAAQIIKEAKGRLIFDAKKGLERPLENSDIVILLRGVKGYADIYYEALMKVGIPAFVDTSDGYFDTLEIEVFLNLLRIIDNRQQDLPLLSILRSPIFGFSVEELILIRLKNKIGPYHQVFREWAEQDQADEKPSVEIDQLVADDQFAAGDHRKLTEKCKKALDRIERWKRQAPIMPLEDFLWMLIRETGYYEYIGGVPGGSQRQANLRALIDKAVQFQSSQMKGLFRFINYIEAIKKRKVPMGQVKLLGENDDVVRIMTIHKSKGLEFPMVLVGGLGKRFNRQSDTYQVSLHKEIGMGLRLVDKENSCYKKTLIQTVADQRKRRESLAEELRILYVAFTRAMDKLVLLGTVKDLDASMESYAMKDGDFTGAASYLDFLIPAMKHSSIRLYCADRRDISMKKEETVQQKDVIRRWIQEESRRKDFHEEGRAHLQAEIERRMSYRYKHRNALKLKSKFTVSELSRLGEAPGGHEQEHREFTAVKVTPSLETPKFTRGKKRFTAAERGTILHKVMEQLDFHTMEESNKANETVRAKVADLVHREILTEEEGEAVPASRITGFFASEIGKRACRAQKLHKEVSFNIMKDISGEKIIIQGTIDCYFEENGKYILLDYKSNYVRDEEDETDINRIAESYRTQLSLYKEALERIRKIRVEEAYLYLFSLGREIRIV